MSPSPLQIKVKALQRLLKEETLYAEEVQQNAEGLERLKSLGADQYELKRQQQVLDESKRMIPEVKKKITEHKQSLVTFLRSYNGDEDISIAQTLVQ